MIRVSINECVSALSYVKSASQAHLACQRILTLATLSSAPVRYRLYLLPTHGAGIAGMVTALILYALDTLAFKD